MNTLQRRFEKLLRKGSEDDAQVVLILKEFDDADHSLGVIIESCKTWRDAWLEIMTLQLNIVTEFDALYRPIPGEAASRHNVEASPAQVDRIEKLKDAYAELKTELQGDINAIDARIVRPATDARAYLQPLKKTIKKRDNKKLDMERYRGRVENSTKKIQRSDRDNAALAKSEQELARASEEFFALDAHLRETFPPVIAATCTLLPRLLVAQIMIQNTLVGQYYTILHSYCQDHGFPSPPPPMTSVIADWKSSFSRTQQHAEELTMIAHGKAVQTALGDSQPRRPSLASTKSGSRLRIASATSQRTPSVYETPSETPGSSGRARLTASPSQHASGGDYFSLAAGPGTAKKPAPPVPPKPRRPTQPPDEFVTALYTFEALHEGDLSFREGAQIRVLKKTESTDDWWEGEVDGRRGSFPANYCQ